MKHDIIRYGDKRHCTCGLTWFINESDPHCYKSSRTKKNIKTARNALNNIKRNLKNKNSHARTT